MLYRIEGPNFVAGFLAGAWGEVTLCAPILKAIYYRKTGRQIRGENWWDVLRVFPASWKVQQYGYDSFEHRMVWRYFR